MSPATVQVGAAVLSVPAVWSAFRFLWKRLGRDPKAEAEARKINAEADDSIVNRLYREIERLDKEMNAVRVELAAVKEAADDEKRVLERDNKSLRREVSSLRSRIGQLEEIIYECTTPEDMRAALDKLKAVK